MTDLETAHDTLKAMLVFVQRAVALATARATQAEAIASEAHDMVAVNARQITRLSEAVAAFNNELMAVESALDMPTEDSS